MLYEVITSSYHVVEYDPKTGQVLRKRTEQGFSDASAWARGQAWGLYGFTMAYRETGYARYLEQAERIANFLLSHPHLPADGVPYWDFDAPGIPDTYRDASAASIMASALLELAEFVDVITSYSIHYTKLYEHRRQSPRRSRWRNLLPIGPCPGRRSEERRCRGG